MVRTIENFVSITCHIIRLTYKCRLRSKGRADITKVIGMHITCMLMASEHKIHLKVACG